MTETSIDNYVIKLKPELEKVRIELGFSNWTDIQEKAIPLIQQGLDVVGQSKTGSGKTVAFGFPMLEKVIHGQGLQALVLVPTRELCQQVRNEFDKFSKYKKTNILAVYGGVSINPQIHYLPRADIIISTPGRLLDHIERNTINLSRIKILVLDEADKMFEMGFIDDVKQIITHVPKNRQTMLFSATISHDVYDIVKHYMKNPSKIKSQNYVEDALLVQNYYNVDSRDKFSLLVHLLKNTPKGLKIIFCATRNRVDQLSKNLYKQGLSSQKLHGGLSQQRRKTAMDMFHNKNIDILVASDVAARGLDIKDVALVINYDLPKTSKEYIHRIGRTARAGSEGKVISLISQIDHDNFRRILEDSSIKVARLDNPNFSKVHFVAHQLKYGSYGFKHDGKRHNKKSYSHLKTHSYKK